MNPVGTIDASDMSAIDNGVSHFLFGYNASDFNGNDVTDAADMSWPIIIFNYNFFFARLQ